MPNSQIDQLLANARAGKPHAQFVLSQMRLHEGDLDGMMSWLRKASSAGFPDAIGAMGYCYEKGQGVAVDLVQAREYYDSAVTAGSNSAAFHKAQLLYKSKSAKAHVEQIRSLLTTAAEANVPQALTAIGYLAMQNASSQELAEECFQRGVSLGDPVAKFLITGLGRRASAAISSGSRRSIDIDIPFELFPAAASIEAEKYSDDPEIRLFRNTLNAVDCNYLIQLSRPFLRRAHVIDPDGDKSGMVSEVRTSMSTYLPFEIVDLIARYIELKIITTTDESLESSEPMSILYYSPGEYYRPHVDYFNPKLHASKELLEDGGQRTASAVTYLTAPSVGGGTSFPKLDITVPAAAGGTLWFRNCHNDGRVDERSLHAGDTVIEGEKWVVTKWFRQEPTQYLPL